MIKFDVKNRFTGAVQFTAEIDCGDDASPGIKLGLAVTWAKKEDANLRGADLRGADLRGADLWDANLRGADLWDANLRGADLRGVDLRDANLRGADLRGADLRGADLRGVDLRDANLRGAHGINDYVKCIQLDTYPITYTATHIQIGCERHTHEEWRGFSDAQIRAMDGRAAVDWWGSWKDWLFDLIERCPAKPTGAECANEAAE
jgi:uncharacterized protein YjbI with pentapeptide repeats